jgi:ribonucleoside-diphosphate reductase alpha chain
MTGIASMSPDIDLKQAARVAVRTNKNLAERIGINPAARITTVKPAGTTSLVLGCSSGIHAWHSQHYIRRIRVNKNEAIYSYQKEYHPYLVEDEAFSPLTTAVISFPVKAPQGAVTRTESETDMMERVKRVYLDWVLPTHQHGANTHNVSATISVSDWPTVTDWMWENRDYYNGLSVLPYDGGTYVQAPFEEITEEQYNELVARITGEIDTTKIIEEDDNTQLIDQAACAGGACEIK